jgi:hypothetical protein
MAKIKGGDRISQKLRDLAAKVGHPATLRVGILEGAKYPNGTPVALVGAIQEFGAPRAGIPPRPFMRTTIAKHKDEWPKAMADLLKDNDLDVNKTLASTGEAIAGQIRQSIVDVTSPPLSPVTLMLRKMFGNHPEDIRGRDVAEARRRVAAGESAGGVSTKPLIWTGDLFRSISYEVKTG